MTEYVKSVEKWGLLEVSCEGISEGNPFTELSLIHIRS